MIYSAGAGPGFHVRGGAQPAYPPPKKNLEKIRLFGVKSYIFTRNTPKLSRFPPPGAIFLTAPHPLT